MIVDLVLEAGIAGGVGAGLPLQHDRGSIGHDEPGPDEEHAPLAEGDGAVVLADELRALRDEQKFPGRAVIDLFGHLGGDLSRQIGADAGDERGGNDGARLHDVGRRGLGEPIGTDGSPIGRRSQKSGLAILHVLGRAGVDRWRR